MLLFFFSPFNNNIFQRKDAKLSWETDGKNGVSTSSININWVNMTSYQYSHLRWDLKKKNVLFIIEGELLDIILIEIWQQKKLNYSCKVLIYNQSMGWEFEHSMHMCNVQILNPWKTCENANNFMNWYCTSQCARCIGTSNFSSTDILRSTEAYHHSCHFVLFFSPFLSPPLTFLFLLVYYKHY